MPAQHHARIPRRAPARLLLTLACAGALVLVAPRAASARTRQPAPFVDTGTVTWLINLAPSDLDPASNTSEYGDTVERNIDGTLLTFAGASMTRYAPNLATSWSANADGSVYVFHLRHGVRFHTGRCCMTADDVRYSIARTVSAQLSNAGLFGRFLSNPWAQIKVRDPYTVEFDLGRPQPAFLGAIANQYAAQILDAQALRKHTVTHDWGHAWASAHDLGTGPYVLRSWTRSQQVVLTRFPQYWGGWSGPHFSTVVIRTVPEASTRRELMERGQADITMDLTPQDYDALAKNPRVSVIAPNGTQINYIVMTEAGPLASPYARQALSYAFNYDAYVKGILHGYARRAYGPIPSTLLGYDPHAFHYQTNLALARALLRKAGVKPGTTLTYAFFDPFGSAGEILQAQLAQLGITVKLQQMNESSFYSIFFGGEPASQRPNLMAYGWWPDYNDPYDMCLPILASASAGAAGGNGGFYHDRQVDALLAQMKTADLRTLIADAHKLQDVATRLDPAAIWIAEPAEATVLARALHGYVFNPTQVRTFDFYPMYRR